MKELTPRERVVRALNHHEPDRVPIDLGGRVSSMMENAYWNLEKHLGFQDDKDTTIGTWGTIEYYDERVLEHFDIDIRRVYLEQPHKTKPLYHEDGTWTDELGLSWRKTPNPYGYYSEMIGRPFEEADIEDLERFPWPDPRDPGRYRGLKEKIEHLYHHTDYALCAAAVAGGLFETAQWLRGMDQLLIDLKVNKKSVLSLLEKLYEFEAGLWSNSLDIVGPYIQMVETADDFGMQSGLIISPETYREIVKPYHKKLLELIKSKTQAKILHHSCGSVVDILDELIDTGIDIINPVQPFAYGMGDPFALKKRFGERLVFHGGIDQQRVLPKGTPQEVEAEVKKRIRGLAPGGGYILAAAHNIQDDTPPQNVVAMFEAAKKYGKYPISC